MTGATAARLRATVIAVAVVPCIFAGLAFDLLGAPSVVRFVAGCAIGWRVERRVRRWAERDAA